MVFKFATSTINNGVHDSQQCNYRRIMKPTDLSNNSNNCDDSYHVAIWMINK